MGELERKILEDVVSMDDYVKLDCLNVLCAYQRSETGYNFAVVLKILCLAVFRDHDFDEFYMLIRPENRYHDLTFAELLDLHALWQGNRIPIIWERLDTRVQTPSSEGSDPLKVRAEVAEQIKKIQGYDLHIRHKAIEVLKAKHESMNADALLKHWVHQEDRKLIAEEQGLTFTERNTVTF